MRASYNLSGRRLEGELSFAYTTLTYRARLTQVCNDKMRMRMVVLSSIDKMWILDRGAGLVLHN